MTTRICADATTRTLYQTVIWRDGFLYQSALVDPGDAEPIDCIGCWDDDGEYPCYVFSEEYLLLHAEHDALASLCLRCHQPIRELNRAFRAVAPGLNYHVDCLPPTLTPPPPP